MDLALDSNSENILKQEIVLKNRQSLFPLVILFGLSLFIINILYYIGSQNSFFSFIHTKPGASHTSDSLTEELPNALPYESGDVQSDDKITTQDNADELHKDLPTFKTINSFIKRGDTASSILNDHLKIKEILEISRQSKSVYPLKNIRAGHPYKILVLDDQFYGFDYEINKDEKLVVRKASEGFSIAKAKVVYDIKTQVISSGIDNSLFGAVRKAGESTDLAIKIASIFAWDIDFIRDIRPGDSFSALVEKRFLKGEPAGYEKILAVFFTNKGETHKAFLYKDSDGRQSYYDEKGRSLRKAFLKAPLDLSRITSGYSRRRFHPILKIYRPHSGIDYGARKGTPIKTVGDGVVTKVGFAKSAGRYVKIRHTNGYETGYNHMSKYAKGLKKGKQVYQGDVIGYVGSTGYATGPHLDFRMKKNGRYVNPLKVKSPCVRPVDSKEIDSFLASASSLTKKLQKKENTAVLILAKFNVEKN